jgi:hypothetical protein
MPAAKITLTRAAVYQAFTTQVSRWISFWGKGHAVPVAMPNLVNKSSIVYAYMVSVQFIPSSATPSP